MILEEKRAKFIEVNLEDKAPTIDDLKNNLGVTVEEVRKLKKEYSIDIKRIQEARDIFNRKKDLISKKGEKLFNFSDFNEFYHWYENEKRVCAYCGIEEQVLQDLFNNGILESKRGAKRGRTLEIERRNSKSNEYSADNCVLACYFCNNHKSDIISEDDHKTYFAGKIAQYLRAKHNDEGESYPEFLSIFSNHGDYQVNVKFKDSDASISSQTMIVDEINKLIDLSTGIFFEKMYFDDHLFTIHKYEIDPIGKIIKITTK
jgi:hypothetical protein